MRIRKFMESDCRLAAIIRIMLSMVSFGISMYIMVSCNKPAYRSDKTRKYELYMLGGFKDTLESHYEPHQLRIRSFLGSYSLVGEGTHIPITIKDDCVDFKPIK